MELHLIVPLSGSLDELISLVDCTKTLIEAPHLSEGRGKERETTVADIFRARGPKLKQMAFHSRYASLEIAGQSILPAEINFGDSAASEESLLLRQCQSCCSPGFHLCGFAAKLINVARESVYVRQNIFWGPG